MIKLFDKLDKFIADAEAGVKSAAKKGADILRALADQLESSVAPLVGVKAKATDFDNLDELEDRCQRLQAVADSKSEEAQQPIGAMPKAKAQMGPGLAILLQVVAAALRAFLEKRRKQTEPPEAESEGGETK